MLERFLKQVSFHSEEDYNKNLEFIIPENFNFAYDVMDVWAQEKPNKTALIWTDDEENERFFTFGELKELTDQAASYFLSLGIGKGDMVMLILKRHYEWWISILALHKIGAIAIPATHMLTTHDIIYRNNRAGVKAIICVGEDYGCNERESNSENARKYWSKGTRKLPFLARRDWQCACICSSFAREQQ